jgi:GNAT superfamily N-acetyltransferase
MTAAAAMGGEAVGYYSREKKSETNCLACILTMPHRQKRGYGGLLIDFSYEMARRAGCPGVRDGCGCRLGASRLAQRTLWADSGLPSARRSLDGT